MCRPWAHDKKEPNGNHYQKQPNIREKGKPGSKRAGHRSKEWGDQKEKTLFEGTIKKTKNNNLSCVGGKRRRQTTQKKQRIWDGGPCPKTLAKGGRWERKPADMMVAGRINHIKYNTDKLKTP